MSPLKFQGEIFSTWSADFDFEDVDLFILQVTVTDGLLEDKDNITVYITDVNEIPVLSNLPGSVTISEHHVEDVFAVDAEDPESTLLTYHLSFDPSSGDPMFSINSSSGIPLGTRRCCDVESTSISTKSIRATV